MAPLSDGAAVRRLTVTAVLAVGGAVTGAITAVALSFLGTKVAQAFEPHGRVVYHWAPAEFALIGAIATPLLAWLFLRRAPLWRAITEPALGVMVGTLVALATIPLLGSLIVQPLCVLAGVTAASLRLHWSQRDLGRIPLGSAGNAKPLRPSR